MSYTEYEENLSLYRVSSDGEYIGHIMAPNATDAAMYYNAAGYHCDVYQVEIIILDTVPENADLPNRGNNAGHEFVYKYDYDKGIINIATVIK